MPLLILVSFIWAFSFGLIKGRLAGLDSAFISAARLGLALLVFLPFLKPRQVGPRTAAALTAIGALQFGVMYLAYNESFRYLQAHEIALFTITTPILVTLFADALDRTLRPRALAAASLAVGGAAIIVARREALAPALLGVALVQLSNLAFAIGQVMYQRWRAEHGSVRNREVFGLLYAGAFLVALVAMLIRGRGAAPSAAQFVTLAYLGIIASGLAFFLWNVGATRVSAGTLAAMNNAKIPLAVACSLLVFGEQASLPPLLASLAVMGIAVRLAKPSAILKPEP